MTICVQKEGRLLMETRDSAFMTTQGKKTNQVNKRSQRKAPLETDIKKEAKCRFCRKKGHIRQDCIKFQQWLVKKGTSISLICYETNMINVNHNTWWIDSAYTIHIVNSLQDLRNLRRPVGAERSINFGNKMQSHVEAIGTCNLVLSSGFILELEKTFYVPNFCRNLISISRYVPLGYSFFLEGDSKLFYKSKLIGYGALSDGLLYFNLQNDSTHTVMHV